MGKPRQLTLRRTKTTRGQGKERALFLKTCNRSLEVRYRLPRPWASADGTKRSQPSKAGVSPQRRAVSTEPPNSADEQHWAPLGGCSLPETLRDSVSRSPV